MKYLYSVLIIIIFCIGSFIGGYFYHKPEQIVKTVEIVKNIDHVVYRDYTTTDCCDNLKKYDLTPFNQTFTVKELNPQYTEINLKWNLYERNGEQGIKVPVYQDGNWKLYIGIGLGSAAMAGFIYGGYKLLH